MGWDLTYDHTHHLCSIDAHALADSRLVQLDATLWPLPSALKVVMPVIKRGLGKRVALVTTKLFPDREVRSVLNWLQ